MRKIVLSVAVTLDGFIEGPNGEIDWIASVQDDEATFESTFGELISSIDTIFYGRISYDLWGNYQPDEQAPPMIKQLYEEIHTKKKYVFSKTKSGENVIHGDIKAAVQEIQQQPGKDIWLYGGGQLITSFINLGLVDVFRIAIYPVVLGAGKPLFKEIQDRVGLKLVDVKSSKGGVLAVHYEVNKEAQ